VVGHAAARPPAHGDRGDPECGADLERLLLPLVFIQTDRYKTLPQGLTTFMGEYTTDWGMLFAGLTIAAAPITLLYMALSRQFIQGMTAGAVK
jgi:ABC-type glycerol-3-phosphate transport system permease component